MKSPLQPGGIWGHVKARALDSLPSAAAPTSKPSGDAQDVAEFFFPSPGGSALAITPSLVPTDRSPTRFVAWNPPTHPMTGSSQSITSYVDYSSEPVVSLGSALLFRLLDGTTTPRPDGSLSVDTASSQSGGGPSSSANTVAAGAGADAGAGAAIDLIQFTIHSLCLSTSVLREPPSTPSPVFAHLPPFARPPLH